MKLDTIYRELQFIHLCFGDLCKEIKKVTPELGLKRLKGRSEIKTVILSDSTRKFFLSRNQQEVFDTRS